MMGARKVSGASAPVTRMIGHIAVAWLWLAGATVVAGTPFSAAVAIESAAGAPAARVTVVVPTNHYVYAGSLDVRIDGMSVAPAARPPSRRFHDPLIDEEVNIIEQTFTTRHRLAGVQGTISVTFQGCSATICFPPETHTFFWNGDQVKAQAGTVEEYGTGAAAEDSPWLGGMRVAATAAGYMQPDEFLAFLAGRDVATGEVTETVPGGISTFTDDPSRFLDEKGWWVTALLILLGGLLLNLTPCVLPMIPINLAIIGAGAQSGSRGRGFLLGGIYGLGMALAYGALGIFVVLTGGFFGALQSSPYFNLAIAIVFIVLALALFDVFPIDFSRFQKTGGTSRASAGLALSMGAMAALLAGACVAPVVIAVLLLAGKLYGEGAVGALLLPLLLGVGMALPWPFAGAGLSVLPKPGRWMRVIKLVFGIGVLLMALYYGNLAWRGFRPAAPAKQGVVAGDQDAWEQALSGARATGKPVVLDFWATWCKNCHAMERTTMRDPAVVEAMRDFVLIPVQAERPGEEPALSHLRALGVAGLPTYVMLVP